MERFDAVVVGAGPSGSTAAYHLAQAGARVALIDRARFPRDKPCGGGVTVRAFAQAPVDLTPVVERVISRVRFSYRLGASFDYAYPETLVYMTQRVRLDAYLAEQAASAGAELREGVQVQGVTLGEDGGPVIETSVGRLGAGVLIGADGANGVTARALGLASSSEPGVALEAHFVDHADPSLEQSIALDLGGMPGGYGWSFPKADHLNVGSAGWRSVGGRLRDHLAQLRHYYGLDAATETYIRGHHLPTRADGAPIVRGRALLAGDAAGLVDPLSGEGIYAAFVSGRLAAETTLHFLGEQGVDLYPYEAAVDRELMADIRAAELLRDAYHHWPRPCYEALRRSTSFRRSLCQIMRGEASYATFVKRLGPLAAPLRFWAARGRGARAAASP
jgi:geranylgeranyl reductase family protein